MNWTHLLIVLAGVRTGAVTLACVLALLNNSREN